MSRPPMASQRNLTLTEELEKLEQSITLTLQEIDHNFNRAHRIVTSSILPVVQQYADHSQSVWEGSKFWKQFFEASANVSLNGYEEQPAESETVVTEEDTSQPTPSSSSYTSPPQQESTFSPTSAHKYGAVEAHEDDSSLFEPESTSTPRPTRNKRPPTMDAYDSPYEALRRQIHGRPEEEETPTSTVPSTPRGQTLSESMVDSSPFAPPSTTRHRTPANDVLLHRVLDKNYRIQATPHTQTRLPRPGAQSNNMKTPLTGRRAQIRKAHDDLDSSPLIEAPQLHSEIFDSPAKARRIPGVSVLTPAKKALSKSDPFDDDETKRSKAAEVWDSDSDDEGWPEGMSPPKTMQFHIPQSKLLKTPAREASKRIVEDLLLTAGGNVTDDFDPDSPSVVGGLLEEDTF